MISVCYYYDIKSGYIYTNERTNERRYPYIIYIYDIQICISYINSISVILYQKRRLRVHKDKRGAPSQCMHAIYAWRSARLAAHTRISGSNSPSQFGSNDKGSAHLAASRLARRPYRRISLASICSERGARHSFQDIPKKTLCGTTFLGKWSSGTIKVGGTNTVRSHGRFTSRWWGSVRFPDRTTSELVFTN